MKNIKARAARIAGLAAGAAIVVAVMAMGRYAERGQA